MPEGASVEALMDRFQGSQKLSLFSNHAGRTLYLTCYHTAPNVEAASHTPGAYE